MMSSCVDDKPCEIREMRPKRWGDEKDEKVEL
jgi:hypothetical protein